MSSCEGFLSQFGAGNEYVIEKGLMDMLTEEQERFAKEMGFLEKARLADEITSGKLPAKRLFVELFIAHYLGRKSAEPEVWYDVQPIIGGGEDDDRLRELKIEFEADDWLLEGRPQGTVVPPPSGRKQVRTPNLRSANPSFSALLIGHVRDRFGGDAPAVYRAAHVSRKTYSAIISNELRAVSKDTAIAFALALHLPRDEAEALLRSAGYAFSDFILEDMIALACIVAGIYEIEKVNEILSAHGAKQLAGGAQNVSAPETIDGF